MVEQVHNAIQSPSPDDLTRFHRNFAAAFPHLSIDTTDRCPECRRELSDQGDTARVDGAQHGLYHGVSEVWRAVRCTVCDIQQPQSGNTTRTSRASSHAFLSQLRPRGQQ